MIIIEMNSENYIRRVYDSRTGKDVDYEIEYLITKYSNGE